MTYLEGKRMTAICLCISLLLLLCPSCSRQDKPLACISMVDANDSFEQTVAATLESKLRACGYITTILYCNGNLLEQSAQIQNFITNGASIIIVNCVGESYMYEELLLQAMDNGCRVAVLGCEDSIDHCSVQIMNDGVLEGIRMCDLVKLYLDEAFEGAGPYSVKALLLAKQGKSEYSRAVAGCCLLSEKYLRYFDSSSLQFERWQADTPVYYLDQYQMPQPVDEPTGGLILDQNGYAMLNPYYDERIDLDVYSVFNMSSVFDGQSVVDSLVVEERDINIIISMNGNAAIGAAEQLMYYSRNRILESDLDRLAVFGYGDTAYNRQLVLSSIDNESLLRGFVAQYKVEWAADSILYALRYGEEKQTFYMDSLFSLTSPSKTEVGIATRNGSRLSDYNAFFVEHER